MDPNGRWGREHRMEPEPEEKGYGRGSNERDYGTYDPGYENPPYQRER